MKPRRREIEASGILDPKRNKKRGHFDSIYVCGEICVIIYKEVCVSVIDICLYITNQCECYTYKNICLIDIV